MYNVHVHSDICIHMYVPVPVPQILDLQLTGHLHAQDREGGVADETCAVFALLRPLESVASKAASCTLQFYQRYTRTMDRTHPQDWCRSRPRLRYCHRMTPVWCCRNQEPRCHLPHPRVRRKSLQPSKTLQIYCNVVGVQHFCH